MNNRKIAYLLAVVCGTFFGASFGMFAHGPDAWAGTGVMCAIGACITASEFIPSF
jgi:TM2 domain-containing membrane protein YozV